MALRRSRDDARRGSASALLIVGLANPGEEFEGSRHNVGGDAVRRLAEQRGLTLSLEKRQRARMAGVSTARGLVTLAVPTTYMNESGAAVVALVRRTSLADLRHLVVVHDELDLEPGQLRMKVGGGLAGHNGLRSIADAVGSGDFARLRIGIGKPPSKDRGADYVLARLRGARRDERDADVARASDVLALLLDDDVETVMQRVNAARG